MNRFHTAFFWVLILSALCLVPGTASAYVGPGAGLSAIGAFLAVIMAILAALFGFVWYPIKRLVRKRRKPEDRHEGDGAP